MFKWVEIAAQNNQPRFEVLSQYLRDRGFANEVNFIATKETDLPAVLDEAKKKFAGIRLGRGCGETVLPLFHQYPLVVQRIHSADALVKTQRTWWLRLNSVEGLSRVLARYGNSLDLDSSVLIVGAGIAARVAIMALFTMGFRSFGVSSLDVHKVETLNADLKRTHLGIDVRVIPKEDLILLPGSHGVMVNTTPMEGDNPMLKELNYFNFFKAGGVAVDFSFTPVETFFLKGAQEIGAQCVYGYQISAQTDLIWVEQVTGLRSLNAIEYEQQLGAHLRSSQQSAPTPSPTDGPA